MNSKKLLLAAFEKDRKSVIDSANSAFQKFSEATDSFRNSLNKVESRLNYSLAINFVLAIILGVVIIYSAR